MRAKPIAAAKCALASTGRTKQQQIGALAEPAVAGGECGHLRLGDHRHGLEVEAVKGLSGRQPRLDEMALDAAAAALSDLVLGNGGEEARRRPAFFIGLLGKLRPQRLDGGQPQLVEQQIEARGVDYVGCAHAAPPISAVPMRHS
ncbi:hypothetical protein ACVINX_004724 [Bradyrhizobium diazoefficiens]